MHFAWDQNHSENEWKAVINWSPSENMESVQKKRLMGISNVMSPTWALLQHLKSLQKW